MKLAQLILSLIAGLDMYRYLCFIYVYVKYPRGKHFKQPQRSAYSACVWWALDAHVRSINKKMLV